jgi:predicted secreted protein
VQNFLSEEVKITTVAAVAAGTSTITSTALDMAGYDGALFIIRLGTPAADNSVKITQCDTTGGSYADLTGTKVGDHATDTPLIVDIKRPREQFLKYVVTRTTSTTIDVAVIIQYKSRNRGITQPTNTQIERWSSVAEGTA